MQDIVLGDVTITRVVEYHGPVGMSPATFFPDAPEQAWRDEASWLVPDFVEPAGDMCVSAIQTWVLRSEGRTILVDTGVGNHKERRTPKWHHLNTDYLANLAEAGVRPEDVDLVINTHLHVDHVGWNTRLDGDSWVPTFPNATYLMPRADFDFWNPANGQERGDRNVFDDSVTPVHEAGQVRLWEDGHTIDGNLRLELAPGHTPGSSVVVLESGADRALFVGDLLHSRVARSNVHLLRTLGAEVVLVAPPTLVPTGAERWGAEVRNELDPELPKLDAVMMLRVQAERMHGGFFPSAREYSVNYGLNEARLGMLPEHAVVLHPGPMLRGMEIASAVADSPRAAITEQVRNGVHVRMAVLYHLLAGEELAA